MNKRHLDCGHLHDFPMTLKQRCENEPSTDTELPTACGVVLLESIFASPSARAGYDTRSIFKWSLTGFNSEFPFS